MTWTVQLRPLRRALWGALGAIGATSPAACLDRTLDKDDAAEGSAEMEDDGEAGNEEGPSDTTGTFNECVPDPWEEIVTICYPEGSVECDGTCDDDCRWRLENESCSCNCELRQLCTFEIDDGQCCFTGALIHGACEGRPFVVDDCRVVASTTRRTGWTPDGSTTSGFDTIEPGVRARLGEHVLAMARGEHASVPAFARCILDLVGLGAPASLLSATQRALGEEIEHATATFGLASALLGRSVGPASLPEALAPSPSRSAEQVLLDLLREGCIGETISAAVARIEADAVGSREIDRALSQAVTPILSKIADEETEHAALAWRTAAWLLHVHPELRPRAEQVFAAVVIEDRRVATADPVLAAHGFADAPTRHEIARACWRTLIAPAAARLLAV